MWHQSYGRIAAERLEQDRADAARAALVAQAPAGASDRRVRRAIGGLLIRIGARLAMPPAPCPPSVRPTAR
jgi:hypothetical protein